MFQNLYLLALTTWTLFIPIAIINGIIRERVYKPLTGELLAHQISTIIASIAFISLFKRMMSSRLSTAPKRHALYIGTLWLAMTVIFEFGFGHYIDGISWEKLFADYNILHGRIWGLFLLVIFLTPILIKRRMVYE